jgi:hypothetical protein
MTMKVLSSHQISQTLDITRGKINPNAITLYSMIKDEIYYLPSFLDHYRSLGIEQFLFLDDRSSDGSHEYLELQSDCIIISAKYQYGDNLNAHDPDGKRKTQRAGIWYKQMIPRTFLGNQYVLYADADEYLILPPTADNLREFYDKLERRNIVSVSASLLELYPERLLDLRDDYTPQLLSEMIDKYPFYDHQKLIEFGNIKRIKQKNPSPTYRLFEKNKIKKRSFVSRLTGRKSAYVLHKTPIFRNSPDNWLVGSHHCRLRTSKKILLCLLHMKWTSDLSRRTEQAIKLGSYAKNSERYQNYKKLFEIAENMPDGLLMTTSKSRKYESPQSLLDAGIILDKL